MQALKALDVRALPDKIIGGTCSPKYTPMVRDVSVRVICECLAMPFCHIFNPLHAYTKNTLNKPVIAHNGGKTVCPLQMAISVLSGG